MRRAAALAALAVLAVAPGCGNEGSAGERPRLTVFAAASLSDAFEDYGAEFGRARVRLSFAGSDELAAQIRRGVRPDVYAAANTKLPDELHREGLLERPVVFATNELVIATPAGEERVRSLADLARPGTKLVLGSPSVPVGSYTRELLNRLPARERGAILAGVRSEEPDVKGVAGKLAQGAADAGFVYRSDVTAAGGRLREVPLPKRLGPTVAYGAAVVRGTTSPEQARDFVAGLLTGPGAAALRSAGLGPPPP